MPGIKKRYVIAGTIAALSAIFVYVFVSEYLGGSASHDMGRLILYVKWGNERGDLTYKPRTQQGEDEGPRSFAISDTGEIYILDNVKRRIVIFLNGKYRREIMLETKSYPHDITLSRDSIYLLTDGSLERITFDGSLISKNSDIRRTEGLEENTGRLFTYKEKVVVTSQETSQGNKSACFMIGSLKTTPCNGADILFRTYDVLDTNEDLIFVSMESGRLGVIEDLVAHDVPNGPIVDSYSSAAMYPISTKFRIKRNKFYAMNPEQEGVGFLEVVFHGKGDATL